MVEDHTTPEASSSAEANRRRLIILNRDLFFGVRIGNILRDLGWRVDFTPTTVGFVTAVRTADPPASLGIMDLSATPDWSAIQALTSDVDVTTPLLLFGSHTDVAGLRAAKASGVTRVVSNGEFHRSMVELVDRYART